MKEERNVLRDVIGTAEPKEESRARKYIRITSALIILAFVVYVIVSAAMQKFG